MSATTPLTWHEANQRYLMSAVGMVHARLELHADDGSSTVSLREADKALSDAAHAMPAPPSLETLCAAFGLSHFEREVLLLCAGIELDSTFPAHCAAAQGDPHLTYPTFSLALAALPDVHWSALSPASTLRHWRLIEVESQGALTRSPLRIDERVLHYLTGVQYPDERLDGLIEPVQPQDKLTSSQRALARRIVALWSPGRQWLAYPLVQLCGPEYADKRSILAAACAELQMSLYTLRAADVPANSSEREGLARLWERESVLSSGALLLDCDDGEALDGQGPVIAFAERVGGMIATSCRDPLRFRTRPAVRVDVPRPSAAEQRKLWEDALGPLSPELNGQVESLIAQFSLGARGIAAVSTSVRETVTEEDSRLLGETLWDACRVQARTRLDDLAQRIEPAAAWEDLVLPEAQLEILREISAHVRQRARVYEAWGFGAKSSRGLGISALFAGPSGTGKTMAAEVLAAELRLDLYRIDLSSVVSKYIGETEKNLRRLFDAAEEGGAILLFDEADALFGKRSEVKDSHDRYANIEVSYLLQRMEAYRGLAILTTNMRRELDSAFLRRIRFIVQFPFPDAALRAGIWRRIFPAETPTEGLDAGKLARLSISGGNIRNITLNAAFLAADEGEPVRMTHLLRAARTEYAKLEKPLTEAEIGGWV